MNNPEFRQTLHNLSHNLESANQTAQENIYTFTQQYIDPCLSGLKSCVYDCTRPCFPGREDNLRRKRGRSRGRAEFNFDFYEAWDDEEDLTEGALRWSNDELDGLLAGRGPGPGQPRRQRAMSYGTRGRRNPQPDPSQDPTVIPSSSYLGFLERFPWKIGTRKLRYKPSAADLQENPGGLRVSDHETEPLIEEHEEHDTKWTKGHNRQRSDTATSRSTMNSLSSRGDLIMGDEEEDAVPLDDEFAVMLTRRMTNSGLMEDQSSGKTRTSGGKRPSASRRGTRTPSTKSLASPGVMSQRSLSQKSLAPVSPSPLRAQSEPPTMLDLRQEEEQARREEEDEIKQKREAAYHLALERGLSSRKAQSLRDVEVAHDPANAEQDENAPSKADVQEAESSIPGDGSSETNVLPDPFGPTVASDRTSEGAAQPP
ncbi:hypothetical protein HRR83_007053 [Exophiala dermatitidis]|uniref:Uncharacterized protein n=1 Tax=Exophiala dermatitidis TaxID=5970 RepID=A0AAN6ETE4_EXODE|nr:hypothetical protein HRR73_006092 [Exophiala dermatitidis]KAJ4512589.1 hypothetical protein HRR74_006287 [Exophiala dermatitidis]KAJ4542384.1 hypothetical protein HRR77_005591 [Exophiala dermatitidis]KAJ4546675.1 hypothetical protein HRR78_005676 [Exophiala dermatitidis]KAJ4548071.1 hypothetical protein HRR76_000688 [Exophiala dermatitidis]